MKKRPLTTQPQHPGAHAYQAPGQQHAQDNASGIGDAIQAFAASGGQTAFLFDAGPPGFNPVSEGVQLLTSVFVPRGRVGWIKQLRVAPYCPAPLADPWRGWPANWQDFQPVGAAAFPFRATAQAGFYTTPIGWESYFDTGSEGVIPEWQWWITCLPGPIAKARADAGAGPFSLTDPASWFLVENIAVPASTYSAGVPGRIPGGRFDPQRVQVCPGDPVTWHLQIPEETTALLWCRWQQSTVTIRTRDINGSAIVMPGVPPLLPSFGQLIGYTQSVSSPAALDNARLGWGG